MTALEKPAGPAVTDEDVSVFRLAARAHTDWPGDADGRTRAGIAAVLGARSTAAGPVHGGLYKARTREEMAALVRTGWQRVGTGVDVDGVAVYVLERAP